MSDYKEAVIVINGVQLNASQSMALRVAVSSMLADTQDPLALGDDEHGRFMTKAYAARLSEVEEVIFGNLSHDCCKAEKPEECKGGCW